MRRLPANRIRRQTRRMETWRQQALTPPVSRPLPRIMLPPPQKMLSRKARLRIRKLLPRRQPRISSNTRTINTAIRITKTTSRRRNRRLRCLNTTSLNARARTTCGHRAIGIGAHKAITGFRARGFSLHLSERCGLRVIGAGAADIIASIRATGGRISASMAAWIMDLGIPVAGTTVDPGATADSTITALSPTSMSP
jgi:hypothetical protein